MKTILIIGDIVTVLASFLLASLVRYGYGAGLNWPTAAVLVVLTLAGFAWVKLYNRLMFLNRTETGAQVIKAVVGIAAVFVFSHFVTNFKVWEQSRLVIGVYFGLFLVAALFLRIFFYRRLFTMLYRLKILRRERVLVYDAGNGHAGLKRSLGLRKDIIGYEFVGDYAGDIVHLKKIAAVTDSEKVILFSAAKTFKELYGELKYCFSLDKEMAVVAKVLNQLNIANDVERIGGVPIVWFGNGSRSKISGAARPVVKRMVDIAGAVLGLGVSTVFMALISVLVRATSRGPALFRQKRFTEGGRPFTFLKFRTMYDGVAQEKHQEFVTNLIKNGGGSKAKKSYKMKDDERITPVGNILRKTSLDELPQLLNVLKGEMSIVGPRPPIDYEVKIYQDWHRDRLKVKQGLTGPWQVYGRSSLPFDAAVFLDLYYVHNQSILFDLDLILRTIPAVLKGKGAA